MKESDKIRLIDEKFQQQHYKTNNNCVWLSASLLIDSRDKHISNKMIEMLTKNPSKYEWLFLSKIPKDQKCTGSETLQHLLQSETEYELKKPTTTDTEKGFLTFILRKNTSGLYVCQLEDTSGRKTHFVGIDCDNEEIFDCEESNVLSLTKDNLDYCCGGIHNSINDIPMCHEIKKKY